MKILEEFRKAVYEYGMSKLARKTGITYMTIWSWVDCRHYPSIECMQLCADVMGLEIALVKK